MSTHVEPMLTVADLDAMPDDGNRYEIIEGELLVSKAPSIQHQLVFGELFYNLRSYLKLNPIGEVIATAGLVFSENNAVIPDILFIRAERLAEVITRERVIGAPDLVIEILSPGADNERRDRTAKRQLYGRFGVREYWIVDPLQRLIEVYLLKDGALKPHLTFAEGDNLSSATFPGLNCSVTSLFPRD
ncbi:MAG: Uma2 family endonuclease [Blastocatellia bacterium]